MSAKASLSDSQAAVCDYARRERARGRSLDSIADELRRGGIRDLTADRLEGWLRGAVDEDRFRSALPDPFGGELDETRRSHKFEALVLEAAETVPGAADLLGLNAFGQGAQANGTEPLQDILAGLAHFLVDEIESPHDVFTSTSLHIPKGGRHEVWDYHGTRTTKGSTTVILDASGEVVRIEPMTRPRGQPRLHKRSLQLPVRKCTIKSHCDLDAVLQRLTQVFLTFLPRQHAPQPQAALAHLAERTKRAIGHAGQHPRLMGKAAATAERPTSLPSREARCLRGKRRVA